MEELADCDCVDVDVCDAESVIVAPDLDRDTSEDSDPDCVVVNVLDTLTDVDVVTVTRCVAVMLFDIDASLVAAEGETESDAEKVTVMEGTVGDSRIVSAVSETSLDKDGMDSVAVDVGIDGDTVTGIVGVSLRVTSFVGDAEVLLLVVTVLDTDGEVDSDAEKVCVTEAVIDRDGDRTEPVISLDMDTECVSRSVRVP